MDQAFKGASQIVGQSLVIYVFLELTVSVVLLSREKSPISR